MDEKMKEEMKKVFENLTDEQKEQVKACKSPDEFMKLAGEWGIELPDEVLNAAAGGSGCSIFGIILGTGDYRA